MENFNSEKINQQRAILVGVQTAHSYHSFGEPLQELEGLAKTAGVQVMGKVTQSRFTVHRNTYTGRGKIDEIKTLANNFQAQLVICNDDLTPKQSRSLESTLGLRVMDRTQLILYIFAEHAKSYEAKLQVELAHSQYSLPRLKRLWKHLDRYEGGQNTKGPGEKQLELDRRILKKRIQDLTEDIKKIQERKIRSVENRANNFITVGIVGYTNAGKSTLMNALTNADVLVENKLFSTLDTCTRVWEICQGRKIMLSDTVGFIDKLPHHLVASFKATLEEAAQSEVLLHIIDVSHPDATHHIEVVNEVLASLGVTHKAPLLVFNKIDQVHDLAILGKLQELYPQHIQISALEKYGLDILSNKVLELIESNMNDIVIDIPVTEGKLIAWMEEYCRVLEKTLVGEHYTYRARLTTANANWLANQLHLPKAPTKQPWEE